MANRLLCGLTLLALGTSCVNAQELPPPQPQFPNVPTETPSTPPTANAVAATVNGQAISEMAVYRSLSKENPKNYEQARKELINYLVDNILIDQYLGYLKVEVPAKEIDEKIEQIRSDAQKKKSSLEEVLKKLLLTEPELRRELAAILRWDTFVKQQATDKSLKDLFDKNTNMFDGSQMQARHILIKTAEFKVQPGNTPEQAVTARVQALKKSIEEETAQELAKLPAEEREKERAKVLEKIFAETAAKVSECPSKENGGSLGWFPRTGKLVEPFARAAFALKPYQLSDVVPTEYGFHLILAIDQKPGRDVKFEEIKPMVREIYTERLREAVISAMRPRSQIVINPLVK